MVEKYLDVLEVWFKQRKQTITAFSGGIDSSLVLYLSHHFLGDKAIGCISASASLKQRDLDLAIDFCEKYGIKLKIIRTDELNDENYLQNPANRCYFCKNHLYIALTSLKEKYPGHTLLNGTNADDLGDYRPGLQAAREHNIASPFVDCGINKQMVREIAKHLGLAHWNKPASPCLSSRVPYGDSISRQKLKQIESAEAILNRYGFQDVRVRHFQQEARVEVPAQEMARLQAVFPLVSEEIRQLGFTFCTIDGEGLVSGKLNRALHE
ncbi:ATP-dependent sacrificial sulfur transferase LarE [Tunicatimonas pelagia]|uniref:ATP-dependent sacrificial sulfur transferase LarE n=1 Tax=Tunicatimonas pelagia TaxID=931531 RepID=UPI0026650E2D|nr:ATP-dependent sacrificial sulfur transferase LarE [Tunicatimonas pelagia]WKN43682.1 ATP-dependent sacrificial sulfur transferase LarE [Tunicatimonas pelagia]